MTITSTNIKHKELVAGSTLKEKTHLKWTHGITGICLQRHLGLRLFMQQHSGKANRIPHCVPWDLLRGRNNHADPELLSQTEVEAIETFIVIVDTLEHNCHRWSFSGCSNWRHNGKHTPNKKH